MHRIRVLIFLITILIVGGGAYFGALYARGYKFNTENHKFSPSGLLVIKSNPEGAKVYINGELKGASNLNLSLPPGDYDITVNKEGFQSWAKRLKIEKEVVTEVDAHLFKTALSLSAITFTATENPILSPDFTKISYIVPATVENTKDDKEGLWILETVNLPLGFARDPRRITDGNLREFSWQWSPDGRQILLTSRSISYLIDAGTFTSQAQRINITTKESQIRKEWRDELNNRAQAQLRNTPNELADILRNKTTKFIFSPDETKILYLVSHDDQLPSELVKPVPGASTQKQERTLKQGQIYIYDIKEDRNFLIDTVIEDTADCPLNYSVVQINCSTTLTWFSTSRHLLKAEDGKVTVMDYDGTNRQEVYQGSYITPFAFPTVSTDRLIILTNLGANSSAANLYILNLK